MSHFHLLGDQHIADKAEHVERWLEEHDHVWAPAAMILVLAFYLMAIYSLIYGDAFILREGIPFASMDW